MSDKWTTYFASEEKVYIEPPQHLDKKYDDLLLGITGNLTHEDRMEAAKELCETFNTRHDTQELEQLNQERDELAAHIEYMLMHFLYLRDSAHPVDAQRIDDVLESTPSTSLKHLTDKAREHDNEVIDKCAAVLDLFDWDEQVWPGQVDSAIRALKEKDND